MIWRRWMLGAAAGCLAVVLLAGCGADTRQKVLPIFFDGAPAGGVQEPLPPTRRVRRDLLREIEDLKRELREAQEAARTKEGGARTEEPQHPAEKAKTWEEAAEALPKDAAGRADWVQAIRRGAITPRPGVDLKTPVQAALDLNVDLGLSPSKPFSVTFPHAPHTEWLACGNCHPAIFPLKRGGQPISITMAKIQAGQQCGVCHGKVAFGVSEECARCHTKVPPKGDWRPSEEPRKPIERATRWDDAAKLLPVTAGGPDWVKALAEDVIAPRPGVGAKAADQPVFPLTIDRVPVDQPIFKVVFPHEAHTAWLGCDNCHPDRFQMQAGATPINMGLIYAGQACGACHGKVAFPPTACGRCHPALGGG